MSDNGKLTEFLENLEYCGFIRKYNSIGMKNKNALYQLMDNYTLFYYKFIKDNYINDEQYWSKIAGKPEYNTWCGLAFERVCLQHIEQIKAKLGIQGIISTVYSWSIMGTKEKQGAKTLYPRNKNEKGSTSHNDYNDGVNAKLIRMGYTICCHYG